MCWFQWETCFRSCLLRARWSTYGEHLVTFNFALLQRRCHNEVEMFLNSQLHFIALHFREEFYNIWSIKIRTILTKTVCETLLWLFGKSLFHIANFSPYNNIIQKYLWSHKGRLCEVWIFMDQTLCAILINHAKLEKIS